MAPDMQHCVNTLSLSTRPVTSGPSKALTRFSKADLKDLCLIKSIAISVSRPCLN